MHWFSVMSHLASLLFSSQSNYRPVCACILLFLSSLTSVSVSLRMTSYPHVPFILRPLHTFLTSVQSLLLTSRFPSARHSISCPVCALSHFRPYFLAFASYGILSHTLFLLSHVLVVLSHVLFLLYHFLLLAGRPGRRCTHHGRWRRVLRLWAAAASHGPGRGRCFQLLRRLAAGTCFVTSPLLRLHLTRFFLDPKEGASASAWSRCEVPLRRVFQCFSVF